MCIVVIDYYTILIIFCHSHSAALNQGMDSVFLIKRPKECTSSTVLYQRFFRYSVRPRTENTLYTVSLFISLSPFCMRKLALILGSLTLLAGCSASVTPPATEETSSSSSSESSVAAMEQSSDAMMEATSSSADADAMIKVDAEVVQ